MALTVLEKTLLVRQRQAARDMDMTLDDRSSGMILGTTVTEPS